MAKRERLTVLAEINLRFWQASQGTTLRDLLRQLGCLPGKWHFSYDGRSEDILWLSIQLAFCNDCRFIAEK